jgi:hypothetical protein
MTRDADKIAAVIAVALVCVVALALVDVSMRRQRGAH